MRLKLLNLLLKIGLGRKIIGLRLVPIPVPRRYFSARDIYFIFGVIFAGMLVSAPVFAMMTPHPVELYEKGSEFVEQYQGEASQLDQAEKIFIHCIEKFPESPFGYLGMSRVNTIRAYLYGNRYNMMSIRENSLPFAIKSLELGPSMREVHEHYAVYERIFEQYYKNQKRAQDYLNLFPDHPETFFVIATFLKDQGEPQKALEYYLSALELSPPESLQLKILKRIGYIYLFDLNKPEKAAEYYVQALLLWPESPVLNEYLGISYLNMQKYEQAIEKFKIALEKMETKTTEYQLIKAQGLLMETVGNFKEAIAYLEKASAFGKKDSILHYHLGNLYYKVSSFESAYNHFKYVIDLKPQESNAYYFAGRSAYSLGNRELAQDHYKKYLQLNSDSQEADWIRANNPDLTQIQDSP